MSVWRTRCPALPRAKAAPIRPSLTARRLHLPNHRRKAAEEQDKAARHAHNMRATVCPLAVFAPFHRRSPLLYSSTSFSVIVVGAGGFQQDHVTSIIMNTAYSLHLTINITSLSNSARGKRHPSRSFGGLAPHWTQLGRFGMFWRFGTDATRPHAYANLWGSVCPL